MSRLIAMAVLSTVLMGTASIGTAQSYFAAPNGMQEQQEHHWNDQEDPHWREYQKERHKKYHDWQKASKREQNDYWKWRDKHPDAH